MSDDGSGGRPSKHSGDNILIFVIEHKIRINSKH